MPLVQTRGAASAQGFGEFAQVTAVNYIEDVFSCFLYTGNGSTQTITNGIDLSTKGGLVWTKARSSPTGGIGHSLVDTVRGVGNVLISNDVYPNQAYGTAGAVQAFNVNGYDTKDNAGGDYSVNGTGKTYVSWTFRKQPKFFDVVTYTGTGSNRTIAHSLGSVPGSIIIKRTDTTANWAVYHRSLANTQYLVLNSTAAAATGATWWNSTTPTSAVFSLGTDASVNASGGTYVAYIYAHDAGGFGLSGTDNVISCGSFDANDGEVINLGYEPQWLFYKDSVSVSNWRIADTMRGLTNLAGTNAQTIQQLVPNSTAVEAANSGPVLTSTGFTWNQSGGGNKHIYIAIRRGPMKVPTLGTSVFDPEIYTGDNSNTRVITTGFPPDMVWTGSRNDGGRRVGDRLRGLFTNPGPINATYSSSAEQFSSYSLPQMSGWQTGNGTVGFENSTGVNYVLHAFRRAPSFFDEVCYTGNSTDGRSVNHNLGVEPELMIVKTRSGVTAWQVYAKPLGVTTSSGLLLNDADGANYNTVNGFYATPTASVFYLGTGVRTNVSGATYVAYLFATCAGVSKVGSYTGNAGYTVTVPCGFTAGVRFVLIKRTDSTGDWWVYDSARGITSGNDPYLYLNSTAAEVGGTDYIDSYSAGFEVTSTAPAGLNATGGTYIFLAIA